jgi:hypothetical protein
MDLEIRPAEMAYLTEVDHQDHEALVRSLADHALERGVVLFTALMLADNQPMRHLLADLGVVRALSREAGAVELAVDLRPRVAD